MSLQITDDTFEKIVIAVVTAVITYFATRSKSRLDMTVQYDKGLRDKRLELYKQLWPKTEPLGRYGPSHSYTYKVVQAVSLDMQDWYFREGGLFLSKKSRKPYLELKDQIQTIVENPKLANNPDQPIPPEAQRAIVEAARRLRASLADDIHTRNAPWL
jgi:hypothetical protein